MPTLSAQIDITLRDGGVLSHLQQGFRGHPANPGRAEAVVEKFRDNVAAHLPAATAQAIETTVSGLEWLTDASQLIRLTVRPT